MPRRLRPTGIAVAVRCVDLATLSAAAADFPGASRNPARSTGAEPDQVARFRRDSVPATNAPAATATDGKFGPAPPLNDPLFLAIVPDAELLQRDPRGRPGTPMPAFARQQGGPLTERRSKPWPTGIKPAG